MKKVCLLLILNLIFPCTMGIAYDSDDRPIIWKNRDKPICCNEENCDSLNSVENRQNTLYLRNNDHDNDYLAITSSESNQVFFGMNDKGFSIANSLVGDSSIDSLDEDSRFFNINTEASLIKRAILDCENIECFENLIIDSLTTIDADTISANFAVFDSSGDGGIFEVYATPDTLIWGSIFLDPNSLRYINRTNHFKISFLEYLNPADSASTSYERLDKANQILEEIIDELEYEKLFHLESFLADDSSLPLLRNFSKSNLSNYSIPYPYQNSYNRPFGYIYTENSINRARTVSSGIIKGITPDEEAHETVIWSNIGNPTTAPYFPYKINDFIDYSNNTEGNTIPNAFPLLLRNEERESEFSILTNRIREELFNYSYDCSFNNYLDSYLLKNSEGILQIINQIESNLIQNYPEVDMGLEVQNAYNDLLNYYNGLSSSDFQNFSCETGSQYFSSENSSKIIDKSKHNPTECYWGIFDESGILLDEMNSCFNPIISFPIFQNIIIAHEVSYNGANFSCSPFQLFIGDINIDQSVNIQDIVLLANLVLENQIDDLADINNDGEINVLDIVGIITIILNQPYPELRVDHLSPRSF